MTQTTITTNITSRAFEKGLREIRVKDVESVRAAIMEALGVNNNVSFRNYARGRNNLDVAKAAAIAEIFTRYGVEDPWGN